MGFNVPFMSVRVAAELYRPSGAALQKSTQKSKLISSCETLQHNDACQKNSEVVADGCEVLSGNVKLTMSARLFSWNSISNTLF